MDIYIKPMEKARIIKKKEVLLRDIAEVYADEKIEDEAKKTVVFSVPEEKKKTYLLSIVDVIRVIHRKYSNAVIFNVGERDIILEYLPEAEKKNPFWTLAKVVFVSLILFIGAATTIMCFHSDTQLPLIFQNIYYIFFGENREMPVMLSVPYSIGIGLGIILFFNHFSKVSLTEDPTPIEMEMTTYEKETNASVIDYLGRQKRGK